ncbi:hypothetical protein ACHAP3_005055 [Botrytis cinerea]|uniref:Putative alpha methylacyl-protein n=1 Tax=Botryotinia fuckeliana (strain BcDW1) TaxID=1290391 RepID=M7TLP5_BOTF1|nr:putative alpha methylacyl- protein [Botrytis cinerea BcDW1]
MYSVPEESKKVFQRGILENPTIIPNLPKDFQDHAKKIKFEGEDAPTLPINWRFAESISSIKALEATVLLSLLKKKYGVEPKEVIINTDHAQLFIMSTLLWEINHEGAKVTLFNGTDPNSENGKLLAKWFPSTDIHRLQGTHHRASCTNIYKTKDGRYFHLHGSMNPDPSLDSIGLPHEMDQPSIEASWNPFIEKIGEIESDDMQRIASDEYKQAGTICWTKEEYRNSEHGKANANTGLFEIRHHPNTNQIASWWPETEQTSPKRPLAGLKIVDITRVIAAPAIARGLAEMGASVMRITPPHLQDYSQLHCDLNWGKWNTHLDFRNEDDLEKAKELIRDADVVVTGYRPGVLDKYGLGNDGIRELVKDRSRGIIIARENCYGWHGPWSYRSGWQQISDANCGVSMEFGRAMGNNEPVTPILPNSDYCAGVSGIVGILQALIQRSETGGSYEMDVALNYYSQWLVNSCGMYTQEVWEDLWSRNCKPVFRHYHNMNYTMPRLFQTLIKSGTGKTILRDEFFENRETKAVGVTIRTVKPILRFPNKEVDLRYNVGTRSNGIDAAHWPTDLMTEIVV